MTRRDHALDGMRGIAALLVFFSHVGVMTWWPNPKLPDPTFVESFLWNLGAPSVDMFFVLSGYVLTASLERTQLTGRTIAEFWARRWVRLVPVAWIGLGLGLVVKTWIVPIQHGPLNGLMDMRLPLDMKDVVGLFTMVAPFPDVDKINIPYWSLIVEMEASIIIPVAIAGLRTQGRIVLLWMFVLPFILWYLSDKGETWTISMFMMGVAARTYLRPLPAASARRALFIGLILIFSRHIVGELGWQHRYISAAGAVMAIMAVRAGAANGFLTSRPLAWLGSISYPFYAVHYPILLTTTILLSARGVQTNLAGVAALPFALAIAEIVRRVAEVPSIRISRRIGRQDLQEPAA